MKSNYLPSDYQTFIATSRYARWLEDEGRRETWPETVSRYMTNIVIPFMEYESNGTITTDSDTASEIEEAILNLEVTPSMRAMMTAGLASQKDNTSMYNCSYLAVDRPIAFDEAMYILLNGTGVGFSVERQYVSKLPDIPSDLFYSDTVVSIKDSKAGWAKGLRQVLALLWAGEIPQWDVSKVRPAGARLKTFGGRASGPAPLVDLFNFVVTTFKNASGRKLSSVEAHDIMCKIGEVVVVGGVRRSAMISLSNLSDDRMRHAKSGAWYLNDPQRALANNSVSYSEKPDMKSFMREWVALVESGSGERGIFNREAANKQAAKNGRRKEYSDFGTNPCSEIILRSAGVCNLTECVVRATDDIDSLERKVKLATILGTIQSTYTYFPYLSKRWSDNASEERLLGVSLTGIMDNPLMTNDNPNLAQILNRLKQVAIDTNKEWAELLDIPQSAAITCVKPSGTVSQLVDSSSGLHPRHSPFYIRTVRGDNKDPLTQFMIDQGIPAEPDVMKPDATTVFSFPFKAPDNAVCTEDVPAIEQLQTWLAYQRHWCEHKPSVTINVQSDEWMSVGAFVYEHFDEMSGVSFLPYNEHTYQQAPYQECDETEPKFVHDKDGPTDQILTHSYKSMLEMMPDSIDWSKLSAYEKEDNTSGSQTLACSGDVCEMVDI
jgi:ribonucleoside-diphosphate reductase alpha chain